jgi:hypothetical protein
MDRSDFDCSLTVESVPCLVQSRNDFQGRVFYLTLAILSPCCGQAVTGEEEMAVTLHERLGRSCDLLQPGILRNHSQYTSISIPGITEENYSPELTRDDFLAVSAGTISKLVELLHMSGFRIKTS